MRYLGFVASTLLVLLVGCATSSTFMDDDSGTTMMMDAAPCTSMCNGMCADTKTDNANCGKCGTVCPMGATCVQGSCQCASGQTKCGNACVDMKTDNANCGKCGMTCGGPDAGMVMGGGTWSCMNGVCGISCPAPKVNCDPDGCVDVKTSNDHCGMCGTACMMNEQCMQGLCCGTGQTICNMMCTDTNNDANNCGMCGTKCPMNTPTCSGGKCTSVISVVLCAASSYKADVQSGLQALNAFSKVDLLDCGTSTPTVNQFAAYDAVLAFSDSQFQNPATLGDNLATYWTNGGTVVLATFGNTTGIAVTGQWGNAGNGYMFIGVASQEQPAESGAITLSEPMSPLVANVTKLTATSAFRSSGTAINGGTVVAKWGSGKPLIVRGVKNNRNIAELNFYPPSSKIRNDFWVGDGFQIMRNALYFK